MIECLTPDQWVEGSSLTGGTAFCPLTQKSFSVENLIIVSLNTVIPIIIIV